MAENFIKFFLFFFFVRQFRGMKFAEVRIFVMMELKEGKGRSGKGGLFALHTHTAIHCIHYQDSCIKFIRRKGTRLGT